VCFGLRLRVSVQHFLVASACATLQVVCAICLGCHLCVSICDFAFLHDTFLVACALLQALCAICLGWHLCVFLRLRVSVQHFFSGKCMCDFASGLRDLFRMSFVCFHLRLRVSARYFFSGMCAFASALRDLFRMAFVCFGLRLRVSVRYFFVACAFLQALCAISLGLHSCVSFCDFAFLCNIFVSGMCMCDFVKRSARFV